MKKKYAYFSFIILVLLTFVAIVGTYAWVRNTQRAKINTELIVSETDSLLVSINNGVTYKGEVSINNSNESNYANEVQVLSLTDLTGDGVDLYLPVIDPYDRTPKSTGWKKIRTDKGLSTDISALNNEYENKSYLSFEVYFQSNKELDIYLSRNSYVLPSESGKQAGQVLFLKRIATYYAENSTVAFDQSRVSYQYVTDVQSTPFTVDDVSQLPTVFNKSVYCDEFDNTIDTAKFLSTSAVWEGEGENRHTTSTQVLFSANYICSAIRVAFIDESKTVDYKDVTTVVDGHLDLTDSKLRLIWAPNPYLQGKDTYDSVTNSHAYSFDIVNETTNPRVNNLNQRIKDNSYYLCVEDGALTGVKKTFNDDIFVDILNDGEDTISIYENASSEIRATLEKPHQLITLAHQDNGKYEAKLRVVLWIEGADPDAIVALTSGDSTGAGNGAGLIRFCLSFFGMEK